MGENQINKVHNIGFKGMTAKYKHQQKVITILRHFPH